MSFRFQHKYLKTDKRRRWKVKQLARAFIFPTETVNFYKTFFQRHISLHMYTAFTYAFKLVACKFFKSVSISHPPRLIIFCRLSLPIRNSSHVSIQFIGICILEIILYLEALSCLHDPTFMYNKFGILNFFGVYSALICSYKKVAIMVYWPFIDPLSADNPFISGWPMSPTLRCPCWPISLIPWFIGAASFSIRENKKNPF